MYFFLAHDLACVASVSNRVIARKLDLLLSQLSRRTSRGNTCYAGFARPRVQFLINMQTVKQSVFFSKSVKKSVKRGVRVLRARSARASHARRACEAREKKRIFSVSPQSRSLFSASFQTFCLTARAYLNTQKYGLCCSLINML